MKTQDLLQSILIQKKAKKSELVSDDSQLNLLEVKTDPVVDGDVKDVSVHEIKSELTTEKTYYENGQKVTEMVTDDSKVEKVIMGRKPMAWVTLEYATNVNLGNYESARVKVGITLPAGAELSDELKSSVDGSYKIAEGFLTARLRSEIEKINGKRPNAATNL